MTVPSHRSFPRIPACLAAGLLSLLASCVLSLCARHLDGFAQTYTLRIYPLWRESLGRLWGLLPFSASELGLYLLIPTGLIWTVRNRRRPLRVFSRLVCLAGCLLLVFTLNCGINYYRTPFSQEEGFQTAPSSARTLYELCEYLTEKVNEYAKSQAGEASSTPDSFLENLSYCYQMGQLAREAMTALGEEYPSLAGWYPMPKPLLGSRLLSLQQLCGIYSPFTVEANYNREMPRYNVPHTLCHELSHLRGFMREDEANFIGWLACIGSPSDDFRYSGWLMGWVYASNALYRVDPRGYEALYQRLDPKAREDLAWNNQFWNRFEGQVAEAASRLNDTYLKAHSQSDGIQSYGRAVDLMLAWYQSMDAEGGAPSSP